MKSKKSVRAVTRDICVVTNKSKKELLVVNARSYVLVIDPANSDDVPHIPFVCKADSDSIKYCKMVRNLVMTDLFDDLFVYDANKKYAGTFIPTGACKDVIDTRASKALMVFGRSK